MRLTGKRPLCGRFESPTRGPTPKLYKPPTPGPTRHDDLKSPVTRRFAIDRNRHAERARQHTVAFVRRARGIASVVVAALASDDPQAGEGRERKDVEADLQSSPFRFLFFSSSSSLQ